MELSEIMEQLEFNECIVFDDLEDALIGVTCGWGDMRAVYEWGRCIEIFMVRDGMTYEEASEHFEHNTAGTYAGPKTPEVVNTGYDPEVTPDGCLKVWDDEYT